MADFTPTFDNYTGVKPFRYWVQTVIPLVYDDSLSYYELLAKVVDYLNKVIEDNKTMIDNIDGLLEAYTQLQAFVNDYFDNLDVQEEIDNKLDEMVEDGTFDNILKPLFDEYTKEINNEILVLKSRMDSFTNLPEGSTTGDAELEDIRVGYNGQTYPNAGSSVRAQITDIHNVIDNAIHTNSIINSFELYVKKTKNTWVYEQYSFNLTDEMLEFSFRWDSVITDSGTNPSPFMLVDFYNGATALSTIYITQNGAVINKPQTADRMVLKIYVNTAQAINEWIKYSNLKINYNIRENVYNLDEQLKLGDRTVEDVNALLNNLDDIIITKSKNILTSQFVQGNINSNGEFFPTSYATNTATPDLISVDSNTEYTLSWKWNDLYTSLYLYEYDENKTFIQATTIDSWTSRISYKNFVTSNNTKYVRFNIYCANAQRYDDIIVKNAQLQIGGNAQPNMSLYDISTMVDYDKVKNNKLIVPDYYHVGGYLTNKINEIKQLMFNAEGDYDAFIFITDTHWEKNQQHSPALINYLKNSLNINKIIHGGDVYDVWSQYFHDEMLNELGESFGEKAKVVVGNHEYKNTYMTDSQIWYLLNSTHKDIIGNNKRDYFYFDDNTTKMRYVILNIYGNGGQDANINFESEQQDWLINTALSVGDDWNIILISHAIYNTNIVNYYLTEIEDVTQPIKTIIDNHNAQHNNQIIFALQGHLHIDRITHTQNGTPIIATTCDKNGMWYDSDGRGDLRYVTRENGTINEQAFDVFVVDKHNKVINAVRIGCDAFNGIDNEMGTQVGTRTVNFNI